MFAEKERQNLASKKAKDNQSPHSITTNFDKVLQKSLKQKLFDQTTKNDLMQEALTQQKETFKNILEGETIGRQKVFLLPYLRIYILHSFAH